MCGTLFTHQWILVCWFSFWLWFHKCSIFNMCYLTVPAHISCIYNLYFHSVPCPSPPPPPPPQRLCFSRRNRLSFSLKKWDKKEKPRHKDVPLINNQLLVCTIKWEPLIQSELHSPSHAYYLTKFRGNSVEKLLGDFFYNISDVFYKVKHSGGHILGIAGPIEWS